MTERDEAQSREQYYFFRSLVEQALTDLFRAESRLRYVMGLSMSDGRLIRPLDDPATAFVSFDFAASHCEALVRRDSECPRRGRADPLRARLDAIYRRSRRELTRDPFA